MNHSSESEATIFAAALERGSPAERAAYLDQACAGDVALRARVEDLLRAHDQAATFLDTSPGASAPMPATVKFDPPADEAAGWQIGRYKLLEKLGEGGFGAVWLAEQREPVRRKVALKIIKLGMDTKTVVARFEAERQALAMMDHPNIAKVLDAGTTETGRPYFVMELVRGIPLTKFCDENQMPTQERLDLFIKVCHAIQHAHQKGIIHRDIKPSNVMVTLHDGVPVPKVIDFGIAKATQGELTDKTIHTQFQQFIGTPAYVSPEQAEMSGLDIDTRSDIYSLGVLLYELLTGSTPFDGKELLMSGLDEMRRTIREKEPARPSTRLESLQGEARTTAAKRRKTEPAKLVTLLRGDVDWIVMKCLEKDRARRYETANGLAADLKRHLSNEPLTARPPSTVYKFQKAFRRNKLAFMAGSAVAAALVFGVAVSTWQAVRATRAKRAEATARQTADEQARVARDNAVRADVERSRAESSELIARQKAYASDMNRLQQALAIGNLGRAEELLKRHRPELEFPAPSGSSTKSSVVSASALRAESQTDLRGWEWRYLWQECQSDALAKICQRTNLPVGALAASADGKWVAVGDFSGLISIWDWRTRQEVASLPAGGFRTRLAFSPRGLLLAYCTTNVYEVQNRTVRLWDGATKKIIRELPLGVGWCLSLVFSEDGQTLITSTAEPENKITLWRVQDGEKLTTYAAPQPKNWGTAFAVTRDLKLAAHATSNARIRVIDLTDGAERWISAGAGVAINALAFSQDGKLLASCHTEGDSTIHLWDVATGTEIKHLDVAGLVFDLAFWPDGKTLACAGTDQTIRLWNLADLPKVPPPAVLRGHKAELHSLALLPDNRMLVSGDYDGAVFIWDTATIRHERSRITLPASVAEWRFAPNSQAVLTVDDKGRVARWSGLDFQNMETLADLGPNVARPLISEDGRLVAAGSTNGVVETWDLQQSGLQRRFTIASGEVSPLRFFDGSKRLVIAHAQDRSLHEWNLDGGREIRFWRGDAQLNKFSFSADGKQYFGFDYGGECLLRDVITNREMTSPFPTKGARGAGFSADGKLLAVASDSPCTWLFETESFREVTKLRGYLQGVASAAFSPDGKRLVTGSDGREAIKLWDVESHEDLLTLDGQGAGFGSSAFSSDGNLLGAGNGRVLHLWRAPSWEEIAVAEAKDPPAPGYGRQGKAENKKP